MLNIVIPYRDRKEHLHIFLEEFPKIVKDINYHITIVEQFNDKPFNRAKLLNIGFNEGKDKFDYFCFHDVDMVPIEADYSFPEYPIHMATNCSQFDWKLPFNEYYGGVNLFNKEDFLKINGYSNDYWGWGIEDDDLLKRVIKSGFKLNRRIGRYKSLDHKKSDPNHENRSKSLGKFYTNYDFKSDGLSNLEYKTINKLKINEFSELLSVDF